MLGRDWLLRFGAREYWDMQYIKVGKSYIPLVDDCNDFVIPYMMTNMMCGDHLALDEDNARMQFECFFL